MTIADLVLRTGMQRQVITDTKLFSGGLQVNGAIQVTSLNHVDVTQLNRTIVRVDAGSAVIHVDTVMLCWLCDALFVMLCFARVIVVWRECLVIGTYSIFAYFN